MTSSTAPRLRSTPESDATWLAAALGLQAGETPFPWQDELLERLRQGDVPRALDLPTGLGKTSVMAVWLAARALGAPLPRRLVYVVDRRAVVDQATAEAVRLRAWVDAHPEVRSALGLEERSLPISTLRGQHVDNREWLEDPASPAIVVGTVDMVGSRLLFEGYGTSRKMRPYHAALLGCDALLVIDEAHLVPPFEALLQTIADGGTVFGPAPGAAVHSPPPVRLMTLTATARTAAGTRLELDERAVRTVRSDRAARRRARGRRQGGPGRGADAHRPGALDRPSPG